MSSEQRQSLATEEERIEERIVEAYLAMAKAGYRPIVRDDLNAEELKSKRILNDEAKRYTARFLQEEDSFDFHIGCSSFETNRALVFTIEAARLLCSGADTLAVKLLGMATDEVKKESSAFIPREPILLYHRSRPRSSAQRIGTRRSARAPVG
jgi:hypothetical protein